MHGGLRSQGGSLFLGKMVAESLGCKIIRVGLPKGLFPGCCDLSHLQMVGVSNLRAPGACSPSREQSQLPQGCWVVGECLPRLGVASFCGLPLSVLWACPALSFPITASCVVPAFVVPRSPQ